MKPAGTLLAVALAAAAPPALAHNPIFAPGPHVTYKGGLDVALEYRRERASGAGEERREQNVALGLEYGLTADWTAELEVPFQDLDENGAGASGLGDIVLRTRYRFLRLDSPGEQRSAALLLQVKLPTGDEDSKPRLGSGSADVVGGLLLGREAGAGTTMPPRAIDTMERARAGSERATVSFSTWSAAYAPCSPVTWSPTRCSFWNSIGKTPSATSGRARSCRIPVAGSSFSRRAFSGPTAMSPCAVGRRSRSPRR